jgi:hypothetical protein
MRDEAKAKRAEEAVCFFSCSHGILFLIRAQKHHFDLQSQADKIAGFEQKLRANNCMALHPNFLAAKFREEYDKERARSRHDRERSTTKEEGEA